MQLGFVSAILPDLSLEEVVAFARASDYECVELMCWPTGKAERRYAGVTHVDVTGLNKRECEAILEVTAGAGVAISGLGYYPNPLTPDSGEARASIQHIKKVIRAASKLEIGLVNSFVGRDWTRSVEANWPRFLKVWRPLVEFAEDQGVRIAIENCPMAFSADEWPGGKNLASTPAIWRRMFEEIPNPNFGLNYDPSHMIWQHMDEIRPLRDFAGRIFHVHAKDVRLDREHLDQVGIMAHPLEFHTPKLPGMGDVNWGHFFSVLGDSGYHGPVCVEVEDRAFEGDLAARKASLRQSATYLRQFLVRE
jgi:sugar phosphate isomerase/epimerase